MKITLQCEILSLSFEAIETSSHEWFIRFTVNHQAPVVREYLRSLGESQWVRSRNVYDTYRIASIDCVQMDTSGGNLYLRGVQDMNDPNPTIASNEWCHNRHYAMDSIHQAVASVRLLMEEMGYPINTPITIGTTAINYRSMYRCFAITGCAIWEKFQGKIVGIQESYPYNKEQRKISAHRRWLKESGKGYTTRQPMFSDEKTFRQACSALRATRRMHHGAQLFNIPLDAGIHLGTARRVRLYTLCASNDLDLQVSYPPNPFNSIDATDEKRKRLRLARYLLKYGLVDNDTASLMNDWWTKTIKFEYKVIDTYNGILDAYVARGGGYTGSGGSCMSGNPNDAIRFYADTGVTKLLSISRGDQYCGRAILWHLHDNVYYLDRIYSTSSAGNLMREFIAEFHRKDGLKFDTNIGPIIIQDMADYNERGDTQLKEKYEFKCKVDPNQAIPYLDTFFWGRYDSFEPILTLRNYRADDSWGRFHSTDGRITSHTTFDSCGDVYSYGSNISDYDDDEDHEDEVYSEYMSEWIPRDDAVRTYENEWVHYDNAFTITHGRYRNSYAYEDDSNISCLSSTHYDDCSYAHDSDVAGNYCACCGGSILSNDAIEAENGKTYHEDSEDIVYIDGCYYHVDDVTTTEDGETYPIEDTRQTEDGCTYHKDDVHETEDGLMYHHEDVSYTTDGRCYHSDDVVELEDGTKHHVDECVEDEDGIWILNPELTTI